MGDFYYSQLAAWSQLAFGQEVSETPAAASTIGTRPSYPGLPRGQASKVETEIGPMKVRFYGTILFNSSISTASVIGQEVPLWAATMAPAGVSLSGRQRGPRWR